MNILTFDTTFDKTYIALVVDNKFKTSAVIASDDEKYHSAYLISSIAKLLRENGLTMADMDKIATNIGPGSFTGIRVCLTVAKIISQQRNIDVYGFKSTEILAQLNNGEKNTIVALDARRGKFYLRMTDSNDKELLETGAYEQNKLYELIKDNNCQVICDKSVKIFLDEKNIPCFCFEENDVDLGKCLASLAVNKALQDKEKHQWVDLNPLYIQPPPITCKNF